MSRGAAQCAIRRVEIPTYDRLVQFSWQIAVVFAIGPTILGCAELNPAWVEPNNTEIASDEITFEGEDDGGYCSTTLPSVGACPLECASCTATHCRLECGADECEDMTITCPPGWSCEVVCIGADACKDATLACPEAHACDLQCEGRHACKDLRMYCGGGPCQVDCPGADCPCEDLSMACGPGDGSISCERPAGCDAPTTLSLDWGPCGCTNDC